MAFQKLKWDGVMPGRLYVMKCGKYLPLRDLTICLVLPVSPLNLILPKLLGATDDVGRT